jgi:hypothetical protein
MLSAALLLPAVSVRQGLRLFVGWFRVAMFGIPLNLTSSMSQSWRDEHLTITAVVELASSDRTQAGLRQEALWQILFETSSLFLQPTMNLKLKSVLIVA